MGEIIEEDIGDEGVALGLNEHQLSLCASHSANSFKWGMTFLEDNLEEHSNYKIKVNE